MLMFSRRLYALSVFALGCLSACLPAPYSAAQSSSSFTGDRAAG